MRSFITTALGFILGMITLLLLLVMPSPKEQCPLAYLDVLPIELAGASYSAIGKSDGTILICKELDKSVNKSTLQLLGE